MASAAHKIPIAQFLWRIHVLGKEEPERMEALFWNNLSAMRVVALTFRFYPIQVPYLAESFL